MRITKIIGVGCILSFVLLLWAGIKVLPQAISKIGLGKGSAEGYLSSTRYYKMDVTFIGNEPDSPFRVILNDANPAYITMSVTYSLPTTAEQLVRLHIAFGSLEALRNYVRSVVEMEVYKESSKYTTATVNAFRVALVNDVIGRLEGNEYGIHFLQLAYSAIRIKTDLPL